jgi:hypothetical protein
MRRTIPFLTEVATLLALFVKTAMTLANISQNWRHNSGLGSKINKKEAGIL